MSQFAEFTDKVVDYKYHLVHLGYWLDEAKKHREEWMGGDMSWVDFLAQPEVGMTVREANSLIKLTEWIEEMDVNVAHLNLSIAKFAATKDIKDMELLEDMKVLSLKDFKERHHEEKTDNAPQTYEYMVMKRSKETGTLSRVYAEGTDTLIEEFKNRIDD
jgi:hypothetical protein